MDYESLEDFYGNIIGLTKEWEVLSVNRNAEDMEVRITVEHSNPVEGKCPVYGLSMPIHDRKLRYWRHLDSCNHKTFIEAEIPRVNCKEHGVHQVDVPWAQKGSRYTIELEK